MRSLACNTESPHWPTPFQNLFTHTPYPHVGVAASQIFCRAVAILPQSSHRLQRCRRIIVFQEVRIPWLTYRVRLMLKKNVAIFGKQFYSSCAIQAGRKAQRREFLRIVSCAVESFDVVSGPDREIP